VNFTDKFKDLLDTMGMVLGMISGLMFLPMIYVFGCRMEGGVDGYSSIEEYTDFMVGHPMILLVMFFFLVYLVCSISKKERRNLKN
jgi:hypothetical protein